MARKIRNSTLETRTARLKLTAQQRPYWITIGDGLGLGYRRNKTGGSWVVRKADGQGGYWFDTFATADDHEDSNGTTVLTFYEAQDRAREVAHGGTVAAPATLGGGAKPKTVGEALSEYLIELQARDGADTSKAARMLRDMPTALKDQPVALLQADTLRAWRDGLLGLRMMANGKPDTKNRSPATVNRMMKTLKAALNRAAELDRKRILNSAEWKTGLKALGEATRAREDVIITDASVISRIIASAYEDSQGPQLGLLAEVCAETGARVSQVRHLLVSDLRMGKTPALDMPVSKKGKGKKANKSYPTPITPGLAQRLQKAARGRQAGESLLLSFDGKPWTASGHAHPFHRAVMRAGVKRSITIMAFRHSSIVRQLMNNVPARVVAVSHDTSVAMIESNYSKHIGNHVDPMIRATLVDFGTVERANVIRYIRPDHRG